MNKFSMLRECHFHAQIDLASQFLFALIRSFTLILKPSVRRKSKPAVALETETNARDID